MTETHYEVRRLRRIFGLAYLWQGASELSSTAIFFFIKEVLRLTDSGGQFFTAASSLGWFVKPLWGWISDRFPIGGRRRRPWFIAMALFAVAAELAAAIGAWTGSTAALYFFIAFNASAVGAAAVDVVGDAIMVEEGQRLGKVSTFVNHQWTMMALASAAAALIGGYLTELARNGAIGYWVIFALGAVLPAATAYAGWRIINEEPRPAPPPRERIKVSESLKWARDIVASHPTVVALFFFLFFWKFNPSVGYVQNSYVVDHRGFTPQIMGVIGMINGVAFLASVVFYRWMTNAFPRVLWHQWLYATVAVGILTMPLGFFMYLEPAHPWWGSVHAVTPDFLASLPYLPQWNQYVWFSILSGIAFSFVTIPAFMIPMQIAGRAISVAHAGVLYAALMSVSNLSSSFGDFLGGIMYRPLWTDEEAHVLSSLGIWLVETFRSTPLEIAGTTDPRTIFLEVFTWIALITSLASLPFIAWVKRVFRREGVLISLND